MRRLALSAALLVLAGAAPASASAQSMDEVNETIAAMKAADSGIAQMFASAAGYAVFPGVGKAGLGIGGARGSGLVFRGGSVTGKVTLTQVSIGFQAGGQKFMEVIFFQTAAAYEAFVGGNFEVNAQVSAVAITTGISADRVRLAALA